MRSRSKSKARDDSAVKTENTSATDNRLLWIDSSLLILACLIAAVSFIWLIADYDLNHQSTELPNRMLHLTGGGEPASLRDLGRAFDSMNLEMDAPRGRYLSYALEVVNFRLRMFLWRYIYPHPSFSFIWLFSLASLWLLYKAAREIGFRPSAALSAVVLYATSIGFLSGFIYLDHPGKPMINVFVIAGIYIYGRIYRVKSGTLLTIRAPFTIVLISLFGFLGVLLDESAVLLFAIIPLMCPRLLVPQAQTDAKSNEKAGPTQSAKGGNGIGIGSYVGPWLVFLAPAVLWLGFMIFAAPAIQTKLGFAHSDLLAGNGHLSSSIPLSWWDPLGNLYTLAGPHMLVDIDLTDYGQVHRSVSPEIMSLRSAGAGLACLLFFAIAAWDIRRSDGILLLKTSLAFAVAVIFIALYISRTGWVTTCTGLYYGNQFSLFYALLVGLLLNPNNSKLNIAGKVLLVLLVSLQIANVRKMADANHEFIRERYYFGRYSFSEIMAAAYPSATSAEGASAETAYVYPSGVPGSKKEIVRIWREWRRNPKSIEEFEKPVSHTAAWLVCELAHINTIEAGTPRQPWRWWRPGCAENRPSFWKPPPSEGQTRPRD